MKTCTECGAKNTNSAKSCNDCGSDIIIFSIGSKKNSEKKEKMPKKSEEQSTYIEKTKLAAGNTENDFANIKFTLQNINTTLEKLDRGNLSQMSEHLWWLALMAKIALVMIILSFIFSKFIIDSIH